MAIWLRLAIEPGMNMRNSEAVAFAKPRPQWQPDEKKSETKQAGIVGDARLHVSDAESTTGSRTAGYR
jgi:hypothetical protein